MAGSRIVLTDATRAEAVQAAARVLKAGGVAFLPAEGVYGLHVLASDEHAVAKLKELKPRDTAKSHIGLIARAEDVALWAAELDPRALALIRAHWPGALTIVLPASPRVPASLRCEDGTVALRVPGNPFLADVAVLCGGLVLSTSANAPGEPPALTAEGFLSEQADLVVDQGPLSGIPSTIVRVERGMVRVLREGAVRIGGSAVGGSNTAGSAS